MKSHPCTLCYKKMGIFVASLIYLQVCFPSQIDFFLKSFLFLRLQPNLLLVSFFMNVQLDIMAAKFFFYSYIIHNCLLHSIWFFRELWASFLLLFVYPLYFIPLKFTFDTIFLHLAVVWDDGSRRSLHLRLLDWITRR